MPKIPSKKNMCLACGGKKVNSKGGVCSPCNGTGVPQAKPVPINAPTPGKLYTHGVKTYKVFLVEYDLFWKEMCVVYADAKSGRRFKCPLSDWNTHEYELVK